MRIDAAPEKRCATVPAGGACTPTSWVGTWQLSLTLVPPRPGMCSGSSVIRPEPTRSLAVDLTTSDGQVCVASGDWQTLQASSDGCALTVSTTTDWKNPSEYGSETVTVRLHTTAGQTTAEYNDSERGFFSCDRTWAGTAQQGTADGGARDDARLGD